jgi:glycosyltransferase involved in cell wall biosynthesis
MKLTFIVNTITAWEEPPRARHQLTCALAKKGPVAFVARNKTGWFGIRVSEPENNIVLIQPYFPVDYRFRYRLPVINGIFQKWLYSKLKKMYPDAIVVNFDFTATSLSSYYPGNIYYCNDEYVGNSKYSIKPIDKYIACCEKKVAQKSKFCIATAQYLKNKLIRYNSFTYEIPLGVSISNISYVKNSFEKNSEKIIVGMMGVINERHASLSVINTILKDVRFYLILIGPVEDSYRKKLRHRDNIEFTGVLKGDELSTKLSEIDVGLALYNMKSVNPGTTPNKLWQYLALGKPAVVSDLPNLQSMYFPEKSVYILRDEALIGQTIHEAFEENSDDLRQLRIEFAMKNTWDQRVEQFLQILNIHLLP